MLVSNPYGTNFSCVDFTRQCAMANCSGLTYSVRCGNGVTVPNCTCGPASNLGSIVPNYVKSKAASPSTTSSANSSTSRSSSTSSCTRRAINSNLPNDPLAGISPCINGGSRPVSPTGGTDYIGALILFVFLHLVLFGRQR
jgi:hypothetical protein